jgi:hypothetical protein
MQIGNVFSPGPAARLAFAVCWFAGQGALVLTAPLRGDRIFSFNMFPEASTLEIHLSRLTDEGIVTAPQGEWNVPGPAGTPRRFAWRDRVHDPVLRWIDARIFASYGVDVQLARLQHALDDMADHVDGDEVTVRLRADVEVRKNGRDPVTVVLLSHPRRRGG